MPTDFKSYAKRLIEGAARAHTDPTRAQREAGNFRHGKAYLHGLEIMIENPEGAYRRGTAPDGKEWKRKVTAHYGRIKRTTGLDGEPVDVWICPDHPESQLVFVVDQLDAEGNLDEHKVVAGTRNYDEAKKVIVDNYPDGWWDSRVGEVRGMTMWQFKELLKKGPHALVKSKTKKAAVALSPGLLAFRFDN